MRAPTSAELHNFSKAERISIRCTDNYEGEMQKLFEKANDANFVLLSGERAIMASGVAEFNRR